MRSPEKSPPRSAPARTRGWEYLFHPDERGPFAGLSLEELQRAGWVVQSTSHSEQGKPMHLLRRPKPKRDTDTVN